MAECNVLGEADMEIELAGGAAIWPEQRFMRVVLLSEGGLDPAAWRTQRKAMHRMMRIDTRGVLYDARQVAAYRWTPEMDWQGSREQGLDRIALVVRSRWTAFLKNILLRWRSQPGEMRVFRDDETAKKWLTRSRMETVPRQA